MKKLVEIALKRPLSFVVLAIFIVIFGLKSIFATPVDVFPAIRIPVVAAVWSYTGLMPEEMSGRIVYYYERILTSTVADIEHIESGSYYGRGVVKIFFQPGVNTSVAQTQITSVSQTVLKQLPRGISPPLIVTLDASSTPVLTLQISNPNMSGSEIYNMASNLIRPQLVSVQGSAIPSPYGGLAPNVMVDLNPISLLAHNLSPLDVANAFNKQNLVLPGGDIHIGKLDPMVHTNSTPVEVEEFNRLPIKQVGNSVIYLRDVGYAHKGGPPQMNAVIVKGHQSVMLVIMKTGSVSTLDVVKGIKKLLPSVKATLPAGSDIKILTDASGFVKEAIHDVVREMIVAAILTSLTVLLFLGSWRATVIVTVSIPLAMLCSLIGLHAMGQSINIMSLGGLALAVGILVDDATVMIENIEVHLGMGKNLEHAITDAANQIVVPTFVSTLCICIVWFPLLSLSGVAGWLFLPLSEAIIFAMIASFILSRTLVPTMANWLLEPHHPEAAAAEGILSKLFSKLKAKVKFQLPAFVQKGKMKAKEGIDRLIDFQKRFDKAFEEFRHTYRELLTRVLSIRKKFIAFAVAGSLASLCLYGFLGRDFFPEVKGQVLQLHMRAGIGTRLEQTTLVSGLVEQEIRRTYPSKIKSVLTNCGLPFSQLNQAMLPTPTIGTQDCDITVSFADAESPLAEYRQRLRMDLRNAFPGVEFTFQPGDITEKILDFGLPAPLDVQIRGTNLKGNHDFAEYLAHKMRKIPGLVDVSVQEPMAMPTIQMNTHRSFALGTGAEQEDVAMNALLALSGSGQVGQTYYLNRSGTSQLIDIQVPASYLQTLQSLKMVPVDKGSGNPENKQLQILGGLSSFELTGTPAMVSHYNILPVFNIYASTEGLDLGKASSDINKLLAQEKGKLPAGSTLTMHGQVETMTHSYKELVIGLIISICLVYLIIVVNFQSWMDPFVIITALPVALGGIAWTLFLSDQSLTIPALTGALMCMGTSTANSVLIVAFARERLDEHGDPILAACEAGFERLRPVVMTASAMIIGMIPMAISNSTNAPLGQVAIGGLFCGTLATLFLVPSIFAYVHYKEPVKRKTGKHHAAPRTA